MPGARKVFAPLVAALPVDAKVIGMVTFDDPETSLWWPLGSRRIEHVTHDDTPETHSRPGESNISWPRRFVYAITLPVEDVIRKYDAKVIAKVPLLLRVQDGVMNWYILEIKPATAAPPHS